MFRTLATRAKLIAVAIVAVFLATAMIAGPAAATTGTSMQKGGI